MTEHRHAWRTVMHLDACHHWSSHYSCTCGAVRLVWAERAFRADPWASMWALPDCERCQALLNGARRRPRRDRTAEP